MKCHTPLCQAEIGDRSKIGLCHRCYSAVYYWHKKTPQQLVKRSRQLQMYTARMSLIMPTATIAPYKRPEPLAILPGEFRKGKKRKVRKVS